MAIKREAKLLRIFLGDNDIIEHMPVYEKIVREAKEKGLAGATVFRGIMGFGKTSKHIHSAKILRLSEDLPIIVEIVDDAEKIEAFLPVLDEIFEKTKCGGLVTIERAEVLKYVKKETE